MKKRLGAFILALILLCLAGCRGSNTAIKVEKNKVDEAEYAFYLNFNRYGDHSKVSSERDLASAREEAIAQIVSNEVVRIKCREYGLTVSKEEKTRLADWKDSFVDMLGGKAAYLQYLKDSCLTDRGYDKLMENELYFDMLFEHVSGDGSVTYTDEQLRRFFAENYIKVKYVFFSFTDDTGFLLGEKEIEAKRNTAKTVLSKAEEDADFDALISEYSEDIFAPGGSGGMIVSRLEAQGTGYLEAAFGLADNEVGGPFEDSTGLYIVKRLPAEASFYEENMLAVNETAENMRFSELIKQWSAEVKVTLSSSVEKITFENLKKYVK